MQSHSLVKLTLNFSYCCLFLKNIITNFFLLLDLYFVSYFHPFMILLYFLALIIFHLFTFLSLSCLFTFFLLETLLFLPLFSLFRLLLILLFILLLQFLRFILFIFSNEYSSSLSKDNRVLPTTLYLDNLIINFKFWDWNGCCHRNIIGYEGTQLAPIVFAPPV